MPKGKPVTIEEVASAAGVAPSEVALVVAADQRVSAQRHQRVVDAISALNYRPLEAVSAALGRSPRLAIAMKVLHGDKAEENRFYTPIAASIAQMCTAHGAEVVPLTIRVNERYEVIDVPADLCEVDCDGAFMVGSQLPAEAVEAIQAKAPPVVLVDGYADGGVFDSVVTDNVAGGWLATEHLIAAGHREIGLLGTEPNCYPSMLGRRTGYTEAIEAHGFRLHYMDTPYVMADPAAIVGLTYLGQHPEVSAVFGANDAVTVALLQFARDSGYEIPGDLSLIGFDDIDMASLVIPALTTLRVDKTMMGRAAFALLAHRLEMPSAECLTSVIEPHLVERESVVPPATAARIEEEAERD